MADNIAITAGTGTTVATDEVGGAHYQYVKPAYGVDGTATLVSTTNPLPTQIRTSAGVEWDPNASAGYSAAVTLTRTADTNVYAALDVLGAATGSTAALTFASMGASAGRVLITSASLEIDITSVTAGMTTFRLHLYSVTPPSALGDNAAWDLPSGDRASYLGFIELGAPADLGSTLYCEANNINKQIKLAGTSIFAYLVTTGTYTPASATVHVITLHAIGI
jgi:hypothetical protein